MFRASKALTITHGDIYTQVTLPQHAVGVHLLQFMQPVTAEQSTFMLHIEALGESSTRHLVIIASTIDSVVSGLYPKHISLFRELHNYTVHSLCSTSFAYFRQRVHSLRGSSRSRCVVEHATRSIATLSRLLLTAGQAASRQSMWRTDHRAEIQRRCQHAIGTLCARTRYTPHRCALTQHVFFMCVAGDTISVEFHHVSNRQAATVIFTKNSTAGNFLEAITIYTCKMCMCPFWRNICKLSCNFVNCRISNLTQNVAFTFC